MANTFNDYLASFPPRLNPTLRILDTLDRCFYILVTGSSVDPSTPLSLEFSVSRMSVAGKVWLKSIIGRTRLHVMGLLEGSMGLLDPPTEGVRDIGERDGDQMEAETENETDGDRDEDSLDNKELEIEVSRVNDRCMMQLEEGLKMNV